MNNYIFTHEGVLKHVYAELPEKPVLCLNCAKHPESLIEIHHGSCYTNMKAYESSLESIRAKGVEIAEEDKNFALALISADHFNRDTAMFEPQKGEFYKVECEVREQRQYLNTQSNEWKDLTTPSPLSTDPLKYRIVVYLSPKKEPDYINPNPKKVSEVDLKSILKQANERNNVNRKADAKWLNKVLSDGMKFMSQEDALKVGKIESNEKPETDWEVCKRSIGQRAIDYAITNYSGTETSDYVMSVAAYSYHRGMNVNGVEVKGEQTKRESQEELLALWRECLTL